MRQLRIIHFVLALAMLSGCGTLKQMRGGEAKYREGYRVESSAANCEDGIADTICQPNATDFGLLPDTVAADQQPTRKELRKAKRHNRKEALRNRKDKRTQARREFVLAKRTIKQDAKTKRVEIRQQGKTDRVFVKQNGRTDRVKTRKQSRGFFQKFSLSLFLLIFSVTFVFLIAVFWRKILKRFNTWKE